MSGYIKEDTPLPIQWLMSHIPWMLVLGPAGFIISNIALHGYHDFIHGTLTFAADFGFFQASGQPDVHFFVNDFLMMFFFLVVGAEVRRELSNFESVSSASVPFIAAAGGVCLPAILSALIAPDYSSTIFGIPMATDIAFALLFAEILNVNKTQRTILLLLAVVDDIFGILVIAAFYTNEIDLTFLMYGGIVSVALLWLGFMTKAPYKGIYLIGAFLLWYLFYKSGIHPTLAGVVAGIAAPYDKSGDSTSDRIERVFATWFQPAILGLFAFVNLGINIQELVDTGVQADVTLGITIGLFIGKLAGVTGALWLAKKWKPEAVPFGFLPMLRIGALAGVGLTVALFINNLAFTDEKIIASAKVGILAGSFLAVIAAWILTVIINRSEAEEASSERPEGMGQDFPGTTT